MRLLFLLILLAGAGVGVVYPWAVTNFSGHEIGSWPVYEGKTFIPVDIQLKAGDTPVRVLVDLTTNADQIISSDRTVLTVTASHAGKTILARALNFKGNPVPREQSPQVSARIFRDDGGLIQTVSDGSYHFVVGRGDAENILISKVDLVLRSGSAEVDKRLQPIGISLMAVGFIGLVLAFRKRKVGRQENPNSQPPPTRWGRGGDTG